MGHKHKSLLLNYTHNGNWYVCYSISTQWWILTKGSAKREKRDRNLRERKKEREEKREREKQRKGHTGPDDGARTTETLWRHLFRTKFSPSWS